MNSRFHQFRGRQDAGRQLAAALMFLKPADPVVLALPRGGVPVAFEVASALPAPLDVVLVQKIAAPFAPELALGAVVEGDPPHQVLSEHILQLVQPSQAYLAGQMALQLQEIARRRALYRGGRQRIKVSGRTVIVVDDGVATGSTMKAALQALAAEGPERLVFAVPVGPPETLESLRDDADDGVCLLTEENFHAVSLFYEDFRQTSDEEVIALLSTPTAPPAIPSGKPGEAGGERHGPAW